MSGLQAAEISEIIASNIAGLNLQATAKNAGTIIAVSDGIVKIHGLDAVASGEMIEFECGLFGLALNLEQDAVGAIAKARSMLASLAIFAAASMPS